VFPLPGNPLERGFSRLGNPLELLDTDEVINPVHRHGKDHLISVKLSNGLHTGRR
jgi:hypothetical protein